MTNKYEYKKYEATEEDWERLAKNVVELDASLFGLVDEEDYERYHEFIQSLREKYPIFKKKLFEVIT